jgi:hypothetical protein
MSIEEVIETNTEEVTKEPGTVAVDEVKSEIGAGETQELGEDEVIVSIGEAQPHSDEEARAPEWVRELRRKQRETVRELREAKAKIEALTSGDKSNDLGPEPQLEDDDISFDPDKYRERMKVWLKRAEDIEKAKAKAEQAEREQSTAWQAKLEGYGKAKGDLKFKDFDEAEAEVQESFSATQQAIIVKGAENPALVVYALGKNPSHAKDLAKIADPVEFAFAVAKLEAQLKVTKKNSIPPPERVLEGTGRVSGTVDSTFAKLEAEADRTGDRTKFVRYKEQLRKNK